MAKNTKYTVVEDFTDLQDKNKVYHKGDVYPNPANKNISKERIKELTSSDNKMGKPVIEESKEQE